MGDSPDKEGGDVLIGSIRGEVDEDYKMDDGKKDAQKRIQFLKGKAAMAEVYDNHHRTNQKSSKKNDQLDQLFIG